MNTRDICWLAGIVEGEGYIGIATSKSPIIQICMTDRDVIEHAARLLGRTVTGPYARIKQCKPMFKVAVFGNRAAGWLMTLYPLLGLRRQERVRATLATWRTYVAHCRDREFCKNGHRLSGANVLAAQWTDARGVVHHEARRCRECHNKYVRGWRRKRAA